MKQRRKKSCKTAQMLYRTVGIFLAAGLLLGTAACKKQENFQEEIPTKEAATQIPTKPTPTPSVSPIPYRDLEGFEIQIGDWWTPETPPLDYAGMLFEEYKQRITEKYHFTIRQNAVATQEKIGDVYMEGIQKGNPAAQVFAMDYRSIGKPLSQGMFYDLATLKELDFEEDKWNKNVKKVMSRGNSIYGMLAEESVPQGGLVWNKKLFAEAGISPELPYELQRTGEWTWSKFEELCKELTRDINGDGITDVYATISYGAETLQCLVASTGKDFFSLNADGSILNNCRDEDVVKAMEFAVSLYQKGYEKSKPENADGKWVENSFRAGEAAMTFCKEAMCGPDGIYGDMEEIGFVLPPKPDGQEWYHSYVCDTVYVIPSCYDAETAGKIAFGYNLYVDRSWDIGEPDAWLLKYSTHFNWKDEKAVYESIPMMVADQRVANPLVSVVLPEAGYDKNGLNLEDFFGQYPFTGTTPESCVNALWEEWQAKLDEINKK